jgi:hypothetical protein
VPIVYPQPKLTLTGSDVLVLEADPDAVYIDDGATCNDHMNGDISEAVVVSGTDYPDYKRPGEYHICFDCTNKHGTAADQLCRRVLVHDTTCPACTVTGEPTTAEDPLLIEASFTYTDSGATCSDSLQPGVALTVESTVHSTGLLSPTVETTAANVNTEVVGTYVVEYRAKDAAGNYNDEHCQGAQSYKRYVEVVDTLKPVIGLHLDGRLLQHGAGGVNNPAEEEYSRMLTPDFMTDLASLVAEQGTDALGNAWVTAGIAAVVAGIAAVVFLAVSTRGEATERVRGGVGVVGNADLEFV